jgi:hypothetical protein
MSALMSARARIADDMELVDDATGEILDVCEIEADAMTLLDRVIRATVEAEAMVAGMNNRIDALQGRRDRFKRRQEELRGAAFAAMDAMGLKRRELPDALVTVAAGTVSVTITDEAALPAHCWRVVPEQRVPDKTTIMANLKAGIETPGAELSNGLPRLQIRTR